MFAILAKKKFNWIRENDDKCSWSHRWHQSCRNKCLIQSQIEKLLCWHFLYLTGFLFFNKLLWKSYSLYNLPTLFGFRWAWLCWCCTSGARSLLITDVSGFYESIPQETDLSIRLVWLGAMWGLHSGLVQNNTPSNRELHCTKKPVNHPGKTLRRSDYLSNSFSLLLQLLKMW